MLVATNGQGMGVERSVPDLGLVADRFDPRIADDEPPRTQLHLLTTYLVL